MEQIDKEAFGRFLTELRKEKGLTQKQLAERLYLSDKAISKWERGQSFPDVAVLLPLAQLLGVTATELLSGRRMETDTRLSMGEVDALMRHTLALTGEEVELRADAKKSRVRLFGIGIGLLAAELALYLLQGHSFTQPDPSLLTVELLMLIFGVYFTFFVQDTLPVYYDENKISTFSQGAVRMHMPGVSFNNTNWPHIVKAVQRAIVCVLAGFPALYLAVMAVAPALWASCRIVATFGAMAVIFGALYFAGREKKS